MIEQLGRAMAKVHCVSASEGDPLSGTDGDESLVDFHTEEAITTVIGDAQDELVADIVEFGRRYAEVVGADHRHFVEAFRAGRIPGVSSA